MSGAVDLFEIKRQRGGLVYDGGRRWSGPGPGHSRQDTSLSVVITDCGRFLVHSFAGDRFQDCAAYLGLPDAKPASRGELIRERAGRAVEIAKAEAEARAFCGRIWGAAVSIEGTPAEAYLLRRGLIYSGAALRFHHAAPRARRPGLVANHPAMIAAVQDGAGSLRGLHVTYIDGAGRKAFADRSRLMFGKTGAGAVRLLPVEDATLAVGEGIETSLAFASLKGVAAWAALSTSGLRAFAPPTSVRRLLIAADNDDSGAGMEAARSLAQRAQRQCAVEIHPAPAGKDWADVAEATHG